MREEREYNAGIGKYSEQNLNKLSTYAESIENIIGNESKKWSEIIRKKEESNLQIEKTKSD